MAEILSLVEKDILKLQFFFNLLAKSRKYTYLRTAHL